MNIQIDGVSRAIVRVSQLVIQVKNKQIKTDGNAYISRFKFKTNIYMKTTIYITHPSRHQNKIAQQLHICSNRSTPTDWNYM
jgi:hypothetical protein